jgi:Zn-dependent peptidase ImmA (M78 family)
MTLKTLLNTPLYTPPHEGMNMNKPQFRWTKKEEAILKARYPHTCTRELAEYFGTTRVVIYAKATNLKLNKSREYMEKQGYFYKDKTREQSTGATT